LEWHGEPDFLHLIVLYFCILAQIYLLEMWKICLIFLLISWFYLNQLMSKFDCLFSLIILSLHYLKWVAVVEFTMKDNWR
jgi:hypothetical protein